MTKVAVGDFNALIGIGINDVLAARRADVVHLATPTIVDYLRNSLPNLVILDSTAPGAADVVRQIVLEHPGIQVITCSTDSPTLTVYPPFHGGESFECSLSDLPSQISS
ncbi:MAG: hypothetical protein KDB60_12840 [Propionibacteriaceae bacterium]|nr:hypothetical protein [Propionibacteriaceae bacterium]